MTMQTRQKTGWPSDNLRLLLKACLAESGAKEAWHEWVSRKNIDDVNWAELRLLAAFANRIDEIDPDSPEKPRLEGIRRFVWAKNQLRLDRCIQVIDILHNANIPVMLLKGMGRIATNPSLASSRFVRDIDILIPSDNIPVACDVLIGNGWRPVNGIFPGWSRAEPFARLITPSRVNKQDDEDFHVDIHRSVIHYGRSGTFDDIFWTRCREGQLRGRFVNIPSETDQFLHAIVHATVADPERPVDWVIDAMDAVKGIDWRLLEMELDRRHAGAAVANTLAYLEADMYLQIPSRIKKVIRRDRYNPLFYLELLVYWRLPEDRIKYGGVIRKAAEWARSRDCLYKPAHSRQTLWEGRKLPKSKKLNPPENLVQIVIPVVEYKLFQSAGQENRLMMEFVITGNNYDQISFDLLINEIWYGRLLIRPSKSGPSSDIHHYFDLSIPAVFINMEVKNLYLVVLDQQYRVPENLPYGLSACVKYANKLLLPHQSQKISDIFSDRSVSINREKAACLL